MKAKRCSQENCNRFALAYRGILCKEHYVEKKIEKLTIVTSR